MSISPSQPLPNKGVHIRDLVDADARAVLQEADEKGTKIISDTIGSANFNGADKLIIGLAKIISEMRINQQRDNQS
jgi:hypothetical protein